MDLDWGDGVREETVVEGLLLEEKYELPQNHIYAQAGVYLVIPSGSVTLGNGYSFGPLEDTGGHTLQIDEDTCMTIPTGTTAAPTSESAPGTAPAPASMSAPTPQAPAAPTSEAVTTAGGCTFATAAAVILGLW